MSGLAIKESMKALVATVKDKSSTILTVGAVIGVGAIVYFAITETPKVNAKLEEKEEDKGEPLTVLEKAVVIAPGYKGTALAAGATVACIIAAQKQNLDKIAMYSGASVMFKDKLDEVNKKLEEKLGPKKAKEVRESMADDYVMSYPPDEANIVNTGKGLTLCMDNLTGTYFYSDRMEIERAAMKLQLILAEDGMASKNCWLDLLHLDEVADGDMAGWNKHTRYFKPKYSNPFEIMITSCVAPDGRPCLVIDHSANLPIPDFERETFE